MGSINANTLEILSRTCSSGTLNLPSVSSELCTHCRLSVHVMSPRSKALFNKTPHNYTYCCISSRIPQFRRIMASTSFSQEEKSTHNSHRFYYDGIWMKLSKVALCLAGWLVHQVAKQMARSDYLNETETKKENRSQRVEVINGWFSLCW